MRQVQQHVQANRIISVSALNEGERPPRKYSSGRVCAYHDCGTRLSIYNKGSYCSHHTKAVVAVRGKKAL